ncbi:hypothetical protein M1247_32170 [Mycobacterium sp. 21AC1]|uniref:hypothetical protein n=1 Tax=[Mycobacterium] appelbergii TaxID=2939269 RepID=UPI0029394874|nr:hypothetical protein [Mycobacterium sp. 21AC1]MDV3129600.1 hypothetical protein [Mycobacterium sp. 21AC1]
MDDTLESERATQDHHGGLSKVVDLDDRGRRFEVEQAPWIPGDDGDDNPDYAQLKSKRVGSSDTDQRFDADKVDPKTFNTDDPVQLKPSVIGNTAAQMIDAGHGFMVDDQQSRPWKTAKRTHCAYCGGEMSPPDVDKYKCEFEPITAPGAACKCSGCTLRELVSRGDARNVGNPRKYCGKPCAKLADSERGRWRTAVKRAQKRGEEPPPEPEDKGLKFVQWFGLRSSIEGAGHRYTASTASGLAPGIPRV